MEEMLDDTLAMEDDEELEEEADAEVDKVFAMGDAFMRLPLEEKMKYEQGDEGNSFG